MSSVISSIRMLLDHQGRFSAGGAARLRRHSLPKRKCTPLRASRLLHVLVVIFILLVLPDAAEAQQSTVLPLGTPGISTAAQDGDNRPGAWRDSSTSPLVKSELAGWLRPGAPATVGIAAPRPGVTGLWVGGAVGAAVGGFYAWRLGAGTANFDIHKMILAGAVAGAIAGGVVDLAVHVWRRR